MSDAALRALERRWRETGRDEDQAAWLRARLRAGALGTSQLALAAWCDHPAARSLARDPPAPEQPASPPARQGPDEGLEALVRGLLHWGKEAAVRAALAAARLTVAVFEREQPESPGPRPWVEAAEAWLREPTGPALAAVEALLGPANGRHRPRFRRARYAHAGVRLLEAILTRDQDLARGLTLDAARGLATMLVQLGGVCVIEPEPERPRRHRVRLLAQPRELVLAVHELAQRTSIPREEAQERLGRRPGDLALSAARTAADRLWTPEGLGPANVRRAIERELAAWALGLEDPARARG